MSGQAHEDGEMLAATVKDLFVTLSEFTYGVQHMGQLPGPERAEIAFAGRSNVGKSSLINALMFQKHLAITSRTPGRTRQLNFFTMGERGFLVDMPGYGYAKISKAERDVWDDLIVSYLKGRPNLLATIVLIDSRHGLKDTDKVVLKLLSDAAVSTRIVLTKIDETSAQEREKVTNAVREGIRKFGSVHPEPLLVSAQAGTGIEELRETLAGLILSSGA